MDAPQVPSGNETPPRKGEPWFFYTVTVLLLVIIAALAGLLLGLQRRYMQSEILLQDAQQALKQNEEAVRLFTENPQLFAPAIKAAELPAEQATLNGQPVRVLQLDSQQAAALGLHAGDLLRVMPAATQTAPTRP